MKKEFVKYLNDIGITSRTLHRRIEQFIESAKFLCNEQIRDIVVEDYIEEDGTRQYTHMDLFTDNFSISVNNFLTQDRLIISSHAGLMWIGFDRKDYDFKNATDKSRLSLRLRFSTRTGEGSYSVSKGNCDHLMYIYRKYLEPHLKNK